MNHRNFCLAIFMLLIGCAEPKYLNPVFVNNKPPSEKTQKTCDIQFSNKPYCLSWYWQTAPSDEAEGNLHFFVFRMNTLDQSPVPIDEWGDVEVRLWMPSMGHGSSPTKTVRADIGSFVTSEVYFVMRGDWLIQFRFRQNGQVVDEISVPFTY